jgi:hypothetical protein
LHQFAVTGVAISSTPGGESAAGEHLGADPRRDGGDFVTANFAERHFGDYYPYSRPRSPGEGRSTREAPQATFAEHDFRKCPRRLTVYALHSDPHLTPTQNCSGRVKLVSLTIWFGVEER